MPLLALIGVHVSVRPSCKASKLIAFGAGIAADSAASLANFTVTVAVVAPRNASTAIDVPSGRSKRFASTPISEPPRALSFTVLKLAFAMDAEIE